MRSLLTVALLLAFTPFVKADANMEAEAALHLAMAQAKLKAPTPGPTVSPPTPTPAPVFTPEVTRSPVGHTHTCANGHTWDHSVTAGHNCPTCGLSQYVQDSRPKAINLGTSMPKYYGISSSGGCASGNCSSATTTTSRGGFFRRP